jgi:poly-gamma-glutamate synthesis protein (capsule biosynthesis protein)
VQKYSKIHRQKKIKFLIRASISCGVILAVVLAGVVFAKFVYITKINEKPVVKIENPFVPDEVSLVMVGDNLLHTPLIKNAEQEDGTLNFDNLYEEMVPYFQEADISVIVQETVLGGKELGYSGYPMFNSPQEVGDSLVRAGFDVVLHSTNHTLDKGAKGVENTLEFWKKYSEVTVLGINESIEKQNSITYLEKNNIKFALLNYSDSTNGIPKPYGKEYLVDTVNEEKIKNDLTIAEQNAEFTIVFMHWGTEYSLKETEFQTNLATMMCENGADLILGSHPHVLEPVKWVEAENGNKALVYYSLGNYVSRQKEANNLLGGMARLKISRNKDDSLSIKEASLMPIVTHYNTDSRGFRVYPLKDYTDELASQHGVNQFDGKVSIERFKNTVEKVFEGNTAVTLDY